MNITIIGGGNIGTDFAVECAKVGHAVTIFTSRPKEFQKTLYAVDENDNIIRSGSIVCATDHLQQAVEEAELLFVTLPAFALQQLSQQLLPYTHAGQYIGLIPGTGGGEVSFKPHLDKGCVLFGLQRVPSICRLLKYGSTVRSCGKHPSLQLASMPNSEASKLSEIISSLFDTPCHALPNYLCVTLTPSNPILHTTRLATMFGDYVPGKIYDREPLFYEDWTDVSSERMLQCDAEHSQLCSALSEFDLSSVVPLRIYYENETASGLTRKIAGIPAFHGIKTPMKTVPGGFIPDFSSRYFTADFPYGLKILIELARLARADTPYMDKTYQWFESVTQSQGGFDFVQYGISNRQQLIEFYR